jgi:hypothetical protein
VTLGFRSSFDSGLVFRGGEESEDVGYDGGEHLKLVTLGFASSSK